MKDELLTTSQAAERLGVGRSTVNLWCRQGKFPNAVAQKEVIGNVWYIPAGDLKDFQPPQRGRPKSPTEGEKRAAGRIRRSNGTSGKKKGGRK